MAPSSRKPVDLGDLPLKIGADGIWYHEGSPIERPEIVNLFARVLTREADGYWLVTPAEKGRIDVEDVPFLALAMEIKERAGQEELHFALNIDMVIVAGIDHPIRILSETNGVRPYILVRPGIEARISRPAYYRMAERATQRLTPEGEEWGVWSRGIFFPLESPDSAKGRVKS